MLALRRDLEASLVLYCRSSEVGGYFGMFDAPSMQLVPLKEAECQLVHVVRPIAIGSTLKVEIPPQNAYFLMVYLDDVFHCDVTPDDGSRTEVDRYERGSASILDLESGAAIELHSSLDAIACVLPHELFREVADASSVTTPRRLICRRGEPDSVLGNLGLVLRGLFDVGDPEPPACVRHLCVAICAHLLHHYSEKTLRNGQMETSLSVWQEKAAKEYMLENLNEQISIASVAAITGLSTNHFAHEFKKATGFSPHRWLTHMRVDHAKSLLAKPRLPLEAIATMCGFSDQSHFTKVFSRQTGITPAAWRSAPFHCTGLF